ncbi:acyltransferase domain-containing protein [Massilia sp. W12]|uniref:acyltransferase domain-containing protein n=1 Tax=Massilia sp. W12 TaxID=3126507 RepID=UPI0030CF0CE9
MSAYAIICPGQASQSAQMFAFALAHGQRDYLDSIWPASLPPWSDLLHSEAMFANRYAQPLVAAASLANWRALQAALPPACQHPSLVLGYSLGALSSCALGGFLRDADCLQLAMQRAARMDAAATQAQGMQSLRLPQQIALPDLLPADAGWRLAILCAPLHLIVAGPLAALPPLQAHWQALGVSARALPVSVAAHTAWQHEAARAFAADLEQVAWQAGDADWLCAWRVRKLMQARAVRESLAGQIEHCLDWAGALAVLQESGVRAVLEIGPGAQFSQPVDSQPAQGAQLSVRALSQFQSAAGAAAWLQKTLSQ